LFLWYAYKNQESFPWLDFFFKMFRSSSTGNTNDTGTTENTSTDTQKDTSTPAVTEEATEEAKTNEETEKPKPATKCAPRSSKSGCKYDKDKCKNEKVPNYCAQNCPRSCRKGKDGWYMSQKIEAGAKAGCMMWKGPFTSSRCTTYKKKKESFDPWTGAVGIAESFAPLPYNETV
jgi:hypothetical protein